MSVVSKLFDKYFICLGETVEILRLFTMFKMSYLHTIYEVMVCALQSAYIHTTYTFFACVEYLDSLK